jgi:hypothetical protein
MKGQYEELELEVIEFDGEDVITESPQQPDSNELPMGN